MSVLVVNAGSSSLKYAVLEPSGDPAAAARRLGGGTVERIGSDGARLRHDGPGGRAVDDEAVDAPDHAAALRAAADALAAHGPSLDDVTAVGHRVVHGGEDFSGPVVVDDRVLARIAELAVLAPLHNPVNAAGIRAARERFGDVPHVAVFDTAFHADLPEVARTYAVPREWREEHGVRRYGFHGTSHAYVSRAATAWLQRERGTDPGAARVVVLHLGNGASACAVRGGRSVDTSMGLTPLAGLVMGSRSGDVDPALAGHLRRVAGLDAEAVEEALNGASGLRGLCGDGDVRDVTRRAEAGEQDAALALAVYAYRVRAYVGAYAVALEGLDALAFTAGVGENSARVRADVCDGLAVLGVQVDPARNADVAAGPGDVVPVHPGAAAGPAVLVVPTDEEGEIARQAVDLLTAGGD
ncbi:acetate/propionate family kinase [Aquipuribacter sp. SD81]|uniref:acetate/propionate family kinase n=1 Tax=Aquipuribacter sp. SD81 TaxID=3127703 RepID=UPI003017EEB3